MNPYVNIHTHHVGEGINILDVGEGKAWVEGEEKRKSVEGQEVFYSVGVHPMKLAGLGENVFTGIEDTVRMEKVIAIGECGLDRRSPICMKTQILRQLLDHGFYISVGAALLNSRSNAFQLLRMIPVGRLFLENDDKEVEISVIYEAASAILGVDVEALKEITRNNCNQVFRK